MAWRNLRDPDWDPNEAGESLASFRRRLIKGIDVKRPRCLLEGAVEEKSVDLSWMDDVTDEDLARPAKLDKDKMGAAKSRASTLRSDPIGASDARLHFGKHKGRLLSDLLEDTDGRGYLRWITDQDYAPAELRIRAYHTLHSDIKGADRKFSEKCIRAKLVVETRVRARSLKPGEKLSIGSHALDKEAYEAVLKEDPKLLRGREILIHGARFETVVSDDLDEEPPPEKRAAMAKFWDRLRDGKKEPKK